MSVDYPGTRPDFNGNGQVDDGEVIAGGISGLWYDRTESDASGESFDILYGVTDRGPQAFDIGDRPTDMVPESDPSFGQKVFEDPSYPLTIYEFAFNGLEVVTRRSITLLTPDGEGSFRNSTGLGGLDTHDLAYEPSGNGTYTLLGRDAFGLDTEAVLRLELDGVNGGTAVFAVSDEYYPQVAFFDAETGELVKRYVPENTDFDAVTDQFIWNDDPAYTFGTFPAIYSERRANRGFEGMAYDPNHNLLYAFIQSPMSVGGSRTATQLRRILAFEPATGIPVAEYVYFQQGTAATDKIGDAVFDSMRSKFYVIDRDSAFGAEAFKYVIEMDISSATNTLGLDWNATLGVEEPELFASPELCKIVRLTWSTDAALDYLCCVYRPLTKPVSRPSHKKSSLICLRLAARLTSTSQKALPSSRTARCFLTVCLLHMCQSSPAYTFADDNDFVKLDGRPDNMLTVVTALRGTAMVATA